MSEQPNPTPSSSLEDSAAEELRLARDTNAVMHSMYRMIRISFWTKLIFWALVIILPVVFIGPIVKTLQSFVPVVQVGGQTVPVFGLPQVHELEKSLHVYTPSQGAEPVPQ